MIFLIGAARSGTKFLRNLLAESEAASCVPFDINYVWRYRNESQPDDIISPELATKEIADFISNTITNMARKTSGTASPIVIEKTVSNVFRVPFVYELFPEAKFVHLIRDGRDVALSAARQWEATDSMGYLFDKIRYFPIRNWTYGVWYLKNALRNRRRSNQSTKIWGPRYPGIEKDLGRISTLEIAAKQWSESILAAQNGLNTVPTSQTFVIHYEDLVTDSGHLRDLVSFLGLPDPENILTSYKSQVSKSKGGMWDQLTKESQSNLLKYLKPALLKFGYLA